MEIRRADGASGPSASVSAALNALLALRGRHVRRAIQAHPEPGRRMAAGPPPPSPSTLSNYCTHIRTSVLPVLGPIPLQQLSPAHLNAFYQALLSRGRLRDGHGMAPKTVQNVHAILHRALKDAMRWGYAARNVADAVEPPKGLTAERQVWTPEQLRAFLSYVRDDRLYAAWLFVATTGLRRAELAGLRWLDVDLAAGRVSPAARGWSSITPSWSPTPRYPRAADRWHSTRPPSPRSGPTRRVRPRRRRSSAAATRTPDLSSPCLTGRRSIRSGSPPGSCSTPTPPGCRIRLHDVRHSYATAALAAGVPPKVISQRLDTPPSRSRWTPTATSFLGWTSRPPRRSPA